MGNKQSSKVITKSIFEFSVESSKGETVQLSSYSGKKAYLIVHVASKWGLTSQNYSELQTLYGKYQSRGLEILAFPCNNFGSQEPGTNEEIQQFATSKSATFPVLGKLECSNNDKTHPLFAYLKDAVSGGVLGNSLKWNFTKFLCDSKGIPHKRFGPQDSPLTFEKDIKLMLEETPE